MWADYSIRYIKNNKVSSIFLAGISFISATFLSLLCSLAYNFWIDHVNQIIILEGSYTKRPESLAAAYGFVIAAASLSLIIMIHNAFEIPMNSRIHQLGILQSVGATPGQINKFLLQEVMLLCFVPIVLGIFAGIGFSCLLMEGIIEITSDIRTYEVSFHFHDMVVLLSLFTSTVTVLLSAWIPARRVSRLTPMEALGYGAKVKVSKMRKFSLFCRMFGIYGELARKSIYARKKELRTSALSFAFAFIALIGLLNIEVISGISTQFTYFERFRDKWDMTLTTTDYSEALLEQLRETEGVESCIAYQKAETQADLSEQSFSKQLREIGIHNLTEDIGPGGNGKYRFPMPIYILDDDSFAKYCADNHLTQTGIVLLNTIWDSVHSSRKHRQYIPLVDTKTALDIEAAGNQLTIDTYASEMPMIKEEYEQYSLTLILSAAYYQKIAASIPATEMTYNIYLTSDEADSKVQEEINALMDGESTYTLESRLEEEKSERKMRNGLKLFIFCFAGFLAAIGIVNMFSFALGQILQRKKEFARYFSIGMSQRGMRKILTIEALIICVRPLMLSVIINIPLVAWALRAAEISASEYFAKAPFLPVGVFTLVVFAFIMLAYYLGGKKVCNGDLVEIIKDETML